MRRTLSGAPRIRIAIFLVAALWLTPPNLADAQGTEQALDGLNLADLLKVRAVTGARHDQRVVDSPRAITVISADDIRRRNYRSLPEAVADAVGVFVQESNDGAGSPIIRGLIGNQVLILVDGIRLNNSSYRLGPNQYLNTIDVNQVERIEVVRGPGSVLYGSDALGGVVNIITRSPARDGPAFQTRWSTRLSTANMGTVGHGELSAHAGSVFVLGGASLKHFDARTGGRLTGVQPQSGYDEWDSDGKMIAKLPWDHEITVAAQHVAQRHVLRGDGVLAGTDLKYEWDPQVRSLVYAQYAANDLAGFVNQFSATLSYHRQSERYARIAATAPSIEMRHAYQTGSIGANIQFASAFGPRHLVTYGIDAYRDRIGSRRDDVSLMTGVSRSEKPALADGARYRSWAVFAQDEFDVSPRLHLNLGTRLSSYHPNATVTEATTGPLTIAATRTAVTGSAFALFRLTSALEITGGVAQGLRAPTIDDLTTLEASGSRFEVPNPNLEPESILNLEAGVRARSLRLHGSGQYFVSDIAGLIQLGTFQGLSFRDFNGNDVKDTPEPVVMQRQNAGRARIHGLELDGQWRLSSEWTLSGTFVRILGEEQVTEQPLRRMPPAHGTFKLGWTSGDRLWFEGYSSFATRQTRLAPGDLTDIRVPAGGTPGFVALHARGGVRLNPELQLTLGIQNLTNRTYRTHGSGIDMPGTNVVFGLDWRR